MQESSIFHAAKTVRVGEGFNADAELMNSLGRGPKTGLEWLVLSRESSLVFTNFGDGREGDASELVSTANAVSVGGYADWRLPTNDELRSLGKTSLAPEKGWFWAPSRFSDNGKTCIVVTFDVHEGLCAESSKDTSVPHHVRLVRHSVGATITPALFEGAGLFEDDDGRQWLILQDEQNLRFTNCGDGRPGDTSSLVEVANTICAAGYSDWRLPDQSELMGLLSKDPWRQQGWFWSSSKSQHEDSYVAHVKNSGCNGDMSTTSPDECCFGHAATRLIRGEIRVIPATPDYFEGAQIASVRDQQWLIAKAEAKRKFTNFGDQRPGDVSELVAQANKVRVGNCDDWRAPDIGELYWLKDTDTKPVSGWFWSSSGGRDESETRIFNFLYDDLSMEKNSSRLHVRLARTRWDIKPDPVAEAEETAKWKDLEPSRENSVIVGIGALLQRIEAAFLKDLPDVKILFRRYADDGAAEIFATRDGTTASLHTTIFDKAYSRTADDFFAIRKAFKDRLNIGSGGLPDRFPAMIRSLVLTIASLLAEIGLCSGTDNSVEAVDAVVERISLEVLIGLGSRCYKVRVGTRVFAYGVF